MTCMIWGLPPWLRKPPHRIIGEDRTSCYGCQPIQGVFFCRFCFWSAPLLQVGDSRQLKCLIKASTAIRCSAATATYCNYLNFGVKLINCRINWYQLTVICQFTNSNMPWFSNRTCPKYLFDPFGCSLMPQLVWWTGQPAHWFRKWFRKWYKQLLSAVEFCQLLRSSIEAQSRPPTRAVVIQNLFWKFYNSWLVFDFKTKSGDTNLIHLETIPCNYSFTLTLW